MDHKSRVADGRWHTKKDGVNSVDFWVLEADQQDEEVQETIGSVEVGGGLGSGLFEEDVYTSLAMLCPECSDDDATDDNDNDDDESHADSADIHAPMSAAEQGAHVGGGRARCAFGVVGGARLRRRPGAARHFSALAPTEATAEEETAANILLSPMF